MKKIWKILWLLTGSFLHYVVWYYLFKLISLWL